MRFQKGEFCENWVFQYVNFWIKCGFLPQCDIFRRNLNKESKQRNDLKNLIEYSMFFAVPINKLIKHLNQESQGQILTLLIEIFIRENDSSNFF